MDRRESRDRDQNQNIWASVPSPRRAEDGFEMVSPPTSHQVLKSGSGNGSADGGDEWEQVDFTKARAF